MKPVVQILATVAVAISLTACGGGGSDPVGGGPVDPISPPGGMSLTLPPGHGLSAGDIRVAPGASRELGNVVVSCPAGGAACVVTVAADGTASYEQTGGVPTVVAAYGSWNLPPGHGLSAGDIRVAPGASRELGNVVVSCPAGGAACVVTVLADGTASYERTGGVPTVVAAYGSWNLPPGHGLAAGEIRVAPGASRELGNVVVSCPLGGAACVVTVLADGTASYERTGGVPTVVAAYGSWNLPPGHGLAAGEIRVVPGASRELGNVVVSCPAGGAACVVTVAVDGTASYERTGGLPTSQARRLPVPFQQCVGATCPHYHSRSLPLQTSSDALQMPIYRAQSSASTPQKLFVGVHQSQLAPTTVGIQGGFDIRYGTVNDGVGAELIAAYLRQTQVDETFVWAFQQPDPDVVLPRIGDIVKYSKPPIVLYGGSFGPQEIDRLVRAVQLVNAALPKGWKLHMPFDVPVDCSKCRNNDFAGRADWQLSLPPDFAHPESFLYVEFTDSEWCKHDSCAPANADVWSLNWDKTSVQYSVEFYSDVSDQYAIAALAHEILHVLGIRSTDRRQGHVDPSFESLMGDGAYFTYNTLGHPLSILTALDREALRVRYDRLEYGKPLTDFGPWASESLHLSGHGPHVSFGVAWRNGYGEPWAHGFLPSSDLSDNPALQGTATWRGVLLGFTSEGEPVAGDARLSVGLTDLTGRADFTSMERWLNGEVPSSSGSGVLWGDGDLSYSIAVSGNTFKQTGGDAGILTGAFFGESHQGVGGTLERDDLTAAFGGSR